MKKTITAKHRKAINKGKQKARELYGLILKIDEDISIWADKFQYIVHFKSDTWYLPTLESCFEEIFKTKVKINLIENKKKEIETIIEQIKSTSDWLKKMFRNLENPKL